MCSYDKKPADLKEICTKLRQSVVKNIKKSSNCTENTAASAKQVIIERFPDSAYDLLKRLLDLDMDKRCTAAEALKHSFFHEN